jgi:hypothetical protein
VTSRRTGGSPADAGLDTNMAGLHDKVSSAIFRGLDGSPDLVEDALV